VGSSDDRELPCYDGETASDDSYVSAREGSKGEQMTAMTAMTADPPGSQRDGHGPGLEFDAAEDENVI